MIVGEPPYELVALFADADTKEFFRVVLERAQEPGRGCVRPFRWRDIRDPRRDPVCREPARDLRPFATADCRFLIVWDHQGSGYENDSPSVAETTATRSMQAIGVSEDRVLAVALEPEFERLMLPVWPKVKQVVGSERSVAAPEDERIFTEAKKRFANRAEAVDEARAQAPKEWMQALIALVGLRSAPALFGKIGRQVSLPALKRDDPAQRVAEALARWFPLEA